MFINTDTDSAYEVSSCYIVKRYTGKYIPCTECPFNDCIIDKKPQELKLLFNVEKVKSTWKEIELGITPPETIEKLGITKRQYWYWKSNKEKIKNKLHAMIEI